MEFGMFHEFPLTPGLSQREAFDRSFEQIDAAERWGLDVMWLAELHAAPTRSVAASPLTLAAMYLCLTMATAATGRSSSLTALEIFLAHELPAWPTPTA